MYQHVRKLLFKLEPEHAHNLTINIMHMVGIFPFTTKLLRTIFVPNITQIPVHVFGLDFPNPIGLAAGYDKDGLGWRGLSALGFGHIEIGTVTVRPQYGNEKPRIFRIPESEAIINRMGFPNRGAKFVARQLQGQRPNGLILGVNIGKSLDTPFQYAHVDYVALIDIFAPLADYLVINISSPNTPGLRAFQSGSALEELLREIKKARQDVFLKLGRNVPVLFKLAPDLSIEQLELAIGEIRQADMDGVILANTSLRRNGLTSPLALESGGMSGKPLRDYANEMLRQVIKLTGGNFPVISSGGVMTPDDAKEKLDSGATLVQLYTGMIYHGPGLVKKIIEYPM